MNHEYTTQGRKPKLPVLLGELIGDQIKVFCKKCNRHHYHNYEGHKDFYRNGGITLRRPHCRDSSLNGYYVGIFLED